ncbi:hypothetical protein ACA910_007736 [Epithemia clementina (nom. ined.)]
MGGDDLGSDDEYLTTHVRAIDDGNDGAADLVVDHETSSGTKKSPKRKRSGEDEDGGGGSSSSNGGVIDSTETVPPNKKQQRLLEASRNILDLSIEERAIFLSAALDHHTKMSVVEGDKDKNSSKSPNIPSIKRLSQSMVQASQQSSLFFDRLVQVSSRKRLKRHKAQGSPSILIICQSARRAVAILKECVPFHTKAAKLFPKQGSVSQQLKEWSSSTFGLAVGTPQRLLALFSEEEVESGEGQGGSETISRINNKNQQLHNAGDGDGDDHKASISSKSDSKGRLSPRLTLDSTQLVVLDAEPSNKKFTVCTLPDTAQWCMKLIQHVVVPELQKRKDIKLAFC